MTTCNTCSSAIPDPAEGWPDGRGCILCQECWEAESDRMWWAAVVALDQLDVLKASGTAAWEET